MMTLGPFFSRVCSQWASGEERVGPPPASGNALLGTGEAELRGMQRPGLQTTWWRERCEVEAQPTDTPRAAETEDIECL